MIKQPNWLFLDVDTDELVRNWILSCDNAVIEQHSPWAEQYLRDFVKTHGINALGFWHKNPKVAELKMRILRQTVAESNITIETAMAVIFETALIYAFVHKRVRMFESTGPRKTIRITARDRPQFGERRIKIQDMFTEHRRVYDSTPRTSESESTGSQKRRHMVREHLRQYKSGKVAYVRAHERGKGDLPQNIILTS